MNNGEMDKQNELRFREKEVVLSNQDIIELLYATKELLEIVKGHKPFWEQSNCFAANFYLCRRMLKHIDKAYKGLQQHSEVVQFFIDNEIDNESDVIRIWARGETEKVEPSLYDSEQPF